MWESTVGKNTDCSKEFYLKIMEEFHMEVMEKDENRILKIRSNAEI